jgi:hypothetical protein
MTWKIAERAACRRGAVVTGPCAASRSAAWLGLALLAFAGAESAHAGGPPLDACALLTAAEVERVQGGALQAAIASGNAASAVATTQCFFRVDPFPRSVSLTLTRADGSPAAQREVRERWGRQLHPQEHRGQTTERDRERHRGESEEARASLTPVAGLGEEALLAGGRGNVSLYVLAPGALLRLSVGGPGEAADWSRQAQALARAALERLKARPPPPPAPH